MSTNCDRDTCFACNRGVCTVLNNTHFRGKCPFYKTQADLIKGRKKARERINALADKGIYVKNHNER